MPRRRRIATAGTVFHVLNRSAKRAPIFETSYDYAAFEQLISQAQHRVSIRVFCYCIMPNHWHFVLQPDRDGDLSRFMHWLTNTHAQRWHAFRGTAGTGAVYQGRFKAIPVQSDDHFLRVCRYVERNAMRANLVADASAWRWCSLWRGRSAHGRPLLSEWPVARPAGWNELVNVPQNEAEVQSIRSAIRHGAPFGCQPWQEEIAASLSLLPSLRPPGRPPKSDREAQTENPSRPLCHR
jgi:putative transposase